jgi:hypothetical protein
MAYIFTLLSLVINKSGLRSSVDNHGDQIGGMLILENFMKKKSNQNVLLLFSTIYYFSQ